MSNIENMMNGPKEVDPEYLEMLKSNRKRTSMSTEDAKVLLEAYDSWAGSLHPDDRDEYLSQFDGLRSRLNKENNDEM